MRSTLTTIFFLTLILAVNISKSQPSNGLVANYTFNQGNANDLAGDNDGVVSGATLTTDRFGNPSHAYTFDGVDDKIDLGDSSEFQMGSNNFSISIWAKYTSQQDAYILSKRSGASQSYNQYTLGVMNNPQFGGVSSNICSLFRSDDPNTVTNTRELYGNNQLGSWHHYVLVHKQNDSTSLYVDGNFVNSSTANLLGTFNAANNPLVLGCLSGLNTKFFQGEIDDFRLYNRDLTLSEIDTLYNEPDPVAVGLDEASINSSTKVYPNPTESLILLGKRFELVQLFDQKGSLIKSWNHHDKLNITNIEAGVYYLRMTSANSISTEKIIKR